MVKAYLRYEPAGAFGVITSGCAPFYDAAGKLLISAALENVIVWNVKQGSQVAVLSPASSGGSDASSSTASITVAEVTCIVRAPSAASTQIAVGYSDGMVRIWDYIARECLVTLKGHKGAVSCLSYNHSGALLASGSKDTELVVWDVVAEAGLFRLRGHRDQVTALAFLSPREDLLGGSRAGGAAGTAGSYLVTCSKDGLVKVWDLEAQACVQTVVGHKAEVWALAVDPGQTRVITGSTDDTLRVYSVSLPGDDLFQEDQQTAAQQNLQGDAEEAGADGGASGTNGSGRGTLIGPRILRPMGGFKRAAGGHDRVAGLVFDEAGGLLVVQSAGKSLEIFRVRDEEEVKRKQRRRLKRRREKAARKAAKKQKGGAGEGSGSDGEAEEEESEEGGEGEEGGAAGGSSAVDEFESFHIIPCKSKVRGVSFAPPPVLSAAKKRAESGSESPVCQLAIALSNNSIDITDIKPAGAASSGSGGPSQPATHSVAHRLELAGHRSDVRTIALSSDDRLLASASNASLKVWNPQTGACLSTMDCSYGLSLLFAPGDRHVILGTKEGTIEVFDLGLSERVSAEQAHEGAVWSLAPLPDGSGFVSGSADKTVKFWQWGVSVGQQQSGGPPQLKLVHVRTLRMADEVLCVKASPDSRLLAVSLLDSTVKVFYLDSLKFFLSLYGHKLPVLTMDISSDSTLLLTGSSDKNIKVWGLDFGDCHRSLFAHGDAVMGVSWVPGTHYAFTVGKDKMVKYWDLDRFEMLLEMPGHHGEVWACAVSSRGDMVVTGGHDRSLRCWRRTSEAFFVEEERERRLESLFEADLDNERGQPQSAAEGQQQAEEGSAAPAGRKTLEAASAADAIVDALEMASHEVERQADHARQLQERQQLEAEGMLRRGVSQAAEKDKQQSLQEALPPNPLLLGLSPSAYVLKSVQQVRAGDLESALLMLPFTDALRLMTYLPVWLEQGAGHPVELVSRVAVLLLRLHHAQLMSTPAARPTLQRLHAQLGPSVQSLKDTLGYNLAALQHLQRVIRERGAVPEPEKTVAAFRKLKGIDKQQQGRPNKGRKGQKAGKQRV